MRPAIALLILLLLIIGCKTNSKKDPQKTSALKARSLALKKKNYADTAEVDPSKIGCIPTAYNYYGGNEHFAPGTFEKTTYIYNSTKPEAKVIDTLSFNTSVNILKEYPNFFLVCSPKAKSGYIKRTDLYLHSIFWGHNNYTYLFGISKYGTNDDTDCSTSILKVIKINESKKIFDVLHDSIQGRYYQLKLIYNSALKNSEALFYLHYDCYSEIGVSTEKFIVDNGKKLSRLIITGGTGDGGDSEESSVYLPVKLDNANKIVLAKNGILTVDDTTAKVELYPYPENCGIPIDELVVVEDRTTETVDDETTDESKYNSTGTPHKKVSITGITYYRWDGNVLRKIKTIKSE